MVRPVIEILLVEDSPTDQLLALEALAEASGTNRVHVAHDGVEAMDFLRGRGRFVDSPRPDLILLDLNLPRKDGREVLAEVKADPSLSTIPVVVLTTSTSDTDVLAAYSLHANCYVAKPLEFERFREAVQSIHEFWFSVVQLPPARSAPEP